MAKKKSLKKGKKMQQTKTLSKVYFKDSGN